MSEDLVINSFCIIRNNKVITGDGQLLFENLPFSEIITKVYHHLSINYPKFYKMDNLSKLGFISSEILLAGKNIHDKYLPEEVGLILANSSSSLDTDKNHQNSINDKANYFPSPAIFVYTLPNIMIGEICIRQKISGEGTFFIHEKFDPVFLHRYVNELFTNNLLKCCIVGWVEMEGNNYESALYFIEKDQINKGIIIFDPTEMNRIYLEKF